MKGIAFNIQKGGVGKTSLTGNIARLISEHHRVLIVDTDPQGNLSTWLTRTNASPGPGLVDVLRGDSKLSQAVKPILYPGGQVDLLGTTPRSGLARYGEGKIADEPYIFEDLKETAGGLGYDFTIFDTSPGLGQLSKSVLFAADEVITPVLPEEFSKEGLDSFFAMKDEIKKGWRINLNHKIIVVNMVNQSFSRHKAFLSAYQSIKDFTVILIPQDKNVAESQIKGQFLKDYAPQARAGAGLVSLMEAINGDTPRGH